MSWNVRSQCFKPSTKQTHEANRQFYYLSDNVIICLNHSKILLTLRWSRFFTSSLVFPMHTAPHVLQEHQTEGTVPKFKLQKTYMKIKGKEKQIAKFPSQKTGTFSAVIYELTESQSFLLYKSLVLGFKGVDISQLDLHVLSWINNSEIIEGDLFYLCPKDLYILLGNLTVGHKSEE